MKRALFVSPLLLAMLLSGCGGESSSGGGPGGGELASNLYGSVQKGPFILGSTVTIEELDNNLAGTGRQFSATTSDNAGHFSKDVSLQSPNVFVSISGYYFDEETNALSESTLALRAIDKVGEEGLLNVNILTTIIEPRIRALVSGGKDIQVAKSQAEGELVAAFPFITLGGNPTEFETMDLSRSGESNGFLLVVSSLFLNATDSPADLSQYLAMFADDFADNGVVDDTALTDRITAVKDTVDIGEMRENLAAYLESVGETGADLPLTGAIFNRAPIGVFAGEDMVAVADTTVGLSCPEAGDLDGDGLTYSWTIVSQPEGSDVTLAGAETRTPSFVPHLAGAYVLELNVSDGKAGGIPDQLSVNVLPATTPASLLSAGGYHGIALKPDGTLWSWGRNFYGQLGDGTNNDSITPLQISGVDGVKAVFAAEGHSMVLKDDGTVYAWGLNDKGQLGDGTTTYRSFPGQVSVVSGIIDISASAHTSLGLKEDGTVWTWGWHHEANTVSPVQVEGIADVSAIAVGGLSGYAVKSDGTLWSWGRNGDGQLGDGTTNYRENPVRVSGLENVTAVEAGSMHALAIVDGEVWGWGRNVTGQLGDGTNVTRYTPVQVPGLTEVVAVAVSYHSLALKSDGTVWAWGMNDQGQVGDGTTANAFSPGKVQGLEGIIAIWAGGQFSMALKNDGTIWAWGDNNYGQLGDGTTTDRLTPVQVLASF